ncbi:MAG: BamA/TamA family outer membrane protein [Armatimonadota bacterium]
MLCSKSQIGRKSALVLVLAVTTALIFSLSLSAFAQEGAKVTQIVITGNRNINKETVENVIKLAPGATYTKEAVEKDREAISALGYFSAVPVRTEDTPEGVRVIFDVVENPLVKEINIVGSEPVGKDTILNIMRTKPNQVLNTNTVDIDISAIQDYYRDLGYVAHVTEDSGIDPKTGTLTIAILVSTVEKIDIVGNKKTRIEVFTREMKEKPGDYFNMKTLRDDIARIWNLDILEDVQAPKIEPGSSIGKIGVAIPVTEKKTGNVSVGVGYNSRSRLVGRAEMTETNFRGLGQGLTLLWETGTSDGIGGSNSYEVGFHEPWIDKYHTSLSVNVFDKLLYRFSSALFGNDGDVDGQTYDERRKGGTLGLSRPISDYTRGYITLRTETVDTTTLNISSLQPSDVNRFVAQSGPVHSATSRIVNNTRDFDSDPAVGWYRSVSFEAGNADVVEQYTAKDLNVPPANENGLVVNEANIKGPFQKLQIDIRHYWSKGGRKEAPTDKRVTLAARLLAGVSNGDLPFFEQFFVGGAESLRGYREDRFWGDKMAVLSIEYRHPVSQGLTGVLFLDYGDAWGAPRTYSISDDLDQHSGFSPSIGTGIGLRVNTPIGNLRFDYGIGSDGARTHFSIGQAF